MKIVDIVNRDIVNLTNCEHEPIHVPGSIQPHGFLLALNSDTKIVSFCSGNTGDYFGLEPKDILNVSFSALFGVKALADFMDAVQNDFSQDFTMRLTLAAVVFECLIHHNGTHYIIEGEPEQFPLETKAILYDQIIRIAGYLNSADTLKELCMVVAKRTREITGYDRVMVYRFDKEYNGEVFAESCNENIEPFLGLHYPHTDIPVQARTLYLTNQVRMIADLGYTPVPIYTTAENPHKVLDLSRSFLRSTSPIHVEYLQNMGVGASLTISLLHRGKLWGLIACHHYSAKNLSSEERIAAQMQGNFLTSQIDIRQLNEEHLISQDIDAAFKRINGIVLPPTDASFESIIQDVDLLNLCNASGVSMQIDGVLYKNGHCPGNREIIEIGLRCKQEMQSGQFYTEKLNDFAPEIVEVCHDIAGILYQSLGNENEIIWYRPETLMEKNWGGDPTKAIVKDANGLHPRNSFKLWKEIVKCRSREWLRPEIQAAANYAHTLEKQISIISISKTEEKYRNLSIVLQEANSELENINWISSHDLQEPLRKIQMFSSRILDDGVSELPENIQFSLSRIHTAAGRMQVLVSDILKYTRIQNTDDAFEMTNLNAIIANVLSDLHELAEEKNAVIEVEELSPVYGIPFLLQQLFSNLIQNSLKYSSDTIPPHVRISMGKTSVNPQDGKTYYSIEVADNGIGFEPTHAESIFKIFARLHNMNEFQGSGIGLALCKKIMKAHRGTISASGEPNIGSVFTLYFPATAWE